ncbi:hypothetical protein ENSA5_30240 [Enhygromyxa salina]|uniref:Uncharacterized protein n=1 Tax=Enhygromyxa salina TaxID=215803 RepID=A0A2S9XZW2_9BACT|nr:hypothetical protein [Enhygromyxa salina]PRP98291.1 hypothetical protein ENSA5_30240 [Enhygromyxa salina]
MGAAPSPGPHNWPGDLVDLVDLARRLAPEELDVGLRVLMVLAGLVRTTGKCEQCIGANVDCEEFADDDCE